MATLVQSVLSILDDARGLLGTVGLRPYRVWVRKHTWSGGRIGVGTKTTTETELTVAGGNGVRVKQVNQRDLVASGGQYIAGDYRVGPMTPEYEGGGVALSTLFPSNVQSVDYRMTGPGLTAAGAILHKVGHELDSPFRFILILRATSNAP